VAAWVKDIIFNFSAVKIHTNGNKLTTAGNKVKISRKFGILWSV